MSFPEIGQIVPLNVTQEARRRVVVGLSWDPREDSTMSDRLNMMRGINSTTYDLDLSCFAYDDQGHFLFDVDGSVGNTIDDSGKVYHSGDNVDGSGEGDDEQVSVELLDMPIEVHQIVFLVDIGSAHAFEDVFEPTVRIADGMTNNDFINVRLDKNGGKNYTACVFARIVRSKDNPDVWNLHHITKFVDMSTIDDWSEALFEYCDKN